jgi:NAD(P)-dependent dehydrogenase (short-subunit alcohol dehydrogenase family)
VVENILITGAGGGLGAALTEDFLRAGATVFAAVRTKSQRLAELHERVGARLFVLTMDVADESSVKAAINQISAVTDHLDVIVNNAGVNLKETVDLKIEDIDFTNMRAVLDVNAIGPLIVLKHSLRLLLKGTRRIIANISSEAGSISGCQKRDWYDYCMSKAALNMASKILQNDLRDRGVKVFAIHPGRMKTKMGPAGATLDPSESSWRIQTLIQEKADSTESIFLSYTGETLEW